MTEVVCSVLTLDPLTFALSFGSGIAFGLSLDRWIVPAVVRRWITVMRRVGRPGPHAG